MRAGDMMARHDDRMIISVVRTPCEHARGEPCLGEANQQPIEPRAQAINSCKEAMSFFRTYFCCDRTAVTAAVWAQAY
jgi:hypothetical protein